MDRLTLIKRIETYIAQNVLDGNDVGLDETTPLLEWGIINSLEIVRLVNFLTKEFDVAITPDQLTADHFVNISTIADFVLESTVVVSATSGSPAILMKDKFDGLGDS